MRPLLQTTLTNRIEKGILRNPQKGAYLLAADPWLKKDYSKQGHDNLKE
jgi:hypothetical protein